MRLIFISDTHGFHRRTKIPEGDVLLHCGDITNTGEPEIFQDFNVWLGELPHAHKVVIMGNHEIGTKNIPFHKKQKLFSNAHYLEDSAITIDGVKFYGSPWQPYFLNWEFNFPKNDYGVFATQIWNNIPDDTQILITHGPPRGLLDRLEHVTQAQKNKNVGCPFLLKKVKQLTQLKVHGFGHLHEAYGQDISDGVQFVNAAICTSKYEPYNSPIVIDIDT